MPSSIRTREETAAADGWPHSASRCPTLRCARVHGRCKRRKNGSTGRARERSSLSVRLRRRWQVAAGLARWRTHPSKEALEQTGEGLPGHPLLNASLAWMRSMAWCLVPVGCGAPEPDATARAWPAPSGSVQILPRHRARCPPAPRRASPQDPPRTDRPHTRGAGGAVVGAVTPSTCKAVARERPTSSPSGRDRAPAIARVASARGMTPASILAGAGGMTLARHPKRRNHDGRGGA